MSTNPIENNTTPKTTGSLEELFRHHLGEEAAAPPRPMLWDQIDNSLLIRQNEIYRRRLTVTRWVAAASLLLATLAGTGWWAGHDARIGGAEVATATRSSAVGSLNDGRTAVAKRNENGMLAHSKSGTSIAPMSSSNSLETVATTSATAAAKGNGSHRSTADLAANGVERSVQNNANTAFGSAGTYSRLGNGLATTQTRRSATASTKSGITGSTLAARSSRATRDEQLASRADKNLTNSTAAARSTAVAQATTTTLGPDGAAVAASNSAFPLLGDAATAATGESAIAALSPAQTSAAAELTQIQQLAARQAALNLNNLTALPNGLATLALPEEPAALPTAHRWHYGATYTAGTFNPNVNFSRAGIASEFGYNPALGAGSPALTEAAATQYRQNLRPGFSQRLALLATRHLTGNWSLSTGAEFTQATAKSATATSFVGEQLYDLGQPSTGPLHSTDFSYRMASIPLEVRYANPIKRGWSIYGRLGGVVSALLGVRSEVEDNPEATRTYSITSAGTPYRRVLGSVRGAAGTQFRNSTGKWAFTLGPVAEIGLVPLNAHPAQSFMAQSRPYSFGMEAGVEFGR